MIRKSATLSRDRRSIEELTKQRAIALATVVYYESVLAADPGRYRGDAQLSNAREGLARVEGQLNDPDPRLYLSPTPEVRKRLLKRPCIYCGDAATQVDHVIPPCRGGGNHEGNFAPACGSCNSSKGNRLIMEWRMKLWFKRGASAAESRVA